MNENTDQLTRDFLNIQLLGLFLFLTLAALSQERSKVETDSLVAALLRLPESESEKIILKGNYLLSQKVSDKEEFDIVLKMASAFLDDQHPNPDKSTEMLFIAKSIAEKTNNPEQLAKVYGSIANQYSYLNFPEKIKFYLDKSRAQIERLPEGDKKYNLSAMLYIEMGNLESDKKNFQVAKKYYQSSLKQFRKMSAPAQFLGYHYRRALYNLGNSFYNLNQYDSAEFYLTVSLSVKDRQNTNLKYFIYYALSRVYSQKGDNQRAIDTLLVVLNDNNFNDDRLKSDIYFNIAKDYKAIGDNENYILYSEKHIKINPNVQKKAMKAINTAVDAEQESFLSDISESKNKNRVLIGGIILLLLISVTTIFYLMRKRDKEKAIYMKIILNLKEKYQQPEKDIPESRLPESMQSLSISFSAEKEVLAKLEKFELSQRFTNQKLTVASVAVQLKTNPTYLTETIKKYKGKNFNAYINELRVHYICEKIHNQPENLNYKISYLGEQCGFASHSAFATVFKNVTGISPSAFLREAEKQNPYIPKSNG